MRWAGGSSAAHQPCLAILASTTWHAGTACSPLERPPAAARPLPTDCYLQPASGCPLQGAATTVFACTAPELEERSGEYLADCQVGRDARGYWGRRFCHPSALARDGDLARQLWEKTEEMIAAALKREQEQGPK